jgi:phage protein U
MTLGLFVFGLDTLAYQTLKRDTQWRHNSKMRAGKAPAYQSMGKGEDKITLSGWQSPELAGDKLSLDQLREMGDSGEPYVMVLGNGEVLGLWVINKVSETQTLFYPNGEPRRIEFTIQITQVDNAQIDRVVAINDAIFIFN